MELVHRAGSCPNGPCPNVFEIAGMEGMAAVQGALLTDTEALNQLSGMPDHERVVLVPRELLLEYARQLAAEGSPA